VFIARLVLGAVFIVAAVGKLADLDGTRRTLEAFGVRGVRPAAIGLLVVELAIGVLLVPAATARAAALAGLVLLLVFSAAIARQLRRGNDVECHCFGAVHSAPVSWSLVGRNAAFAGVAAFIAVAGPGSSIADALAGADPWLVAAAGVAVLVIALQGWVSWQLFEQHGRLIERVRVLEAATDGGRIQASEAPGLPVGEAAPDFDLLGIDGRRRGLSDLLAARVPLVLTFSEPRCGACEALLPQLVSLQAAYAGELDVVLVSRIGTGDNHAEHDVDGLAAVVLQDMREVALRYGVRAVPSAIVVSPEGMIASRLAVGPAAIEELVRNTARPIAPVSLIKVAG
jgi:uncharacterized membrane protein YphA (DoxX/SURF4 family)/thiol-disulfide isomerase/thioredoxin